MIDSCQELTIKLDSDSPDPIERKMMVRTVPSTWSKVPEPIILPFSIHSAIHEGLRGQFNISALLRVIKSHAQQRITILMCEGAHLNVLKLKFNGDIKATKNKCREDAEKLLARFSHELTDCAVLFWEDFINGHDAYDQCRKKVLHHLENNLLLRAAINEEAKLTYNSLRAKQYPDEATYIHHAELDLIEMMVSCTVMYERGFRIHIYPGNAPKAVLLMQPFLYPNMLFVKAMIK